MAALLAGAWSLVAATSPVPPVPVATYAPALSWVVPPPPTTTSTPAGAPVRSIYFDQQIYVSPVGDDVFTAYGVKVLTPQALSVGDISLQWSPGPQQMTVHSLRITRSGQPIDVLAQHYHGSAASGARGSRICGTGNRLV